MAIVHKQRQGEKMKSIKCQFQYCINQNFRESMDKHSIKKQDTSHTNIYSYSEKFRLLDVANDFGKYMKTNFSEVKYVRDIQSKHIQSFLNSKSHCTQNTINSYMQSLKKLERISNKCFGLAKSNMNQVVAPQVLRKSDISRGAAHPITTKDYEKILTYCIENPSKSSSAILLDYTCCNSHSMRVEELARIKLANINEQGTILITNAKGGKSYEVKCSNLSFLKEIISRGYDTNGKFLFDLNGNSINKYLNRTCEKLGIEKYSFHDIRRYHAQTYFDNLREQGFSSKNALLHTSQYLSHNTPREKMMTQSYITLW